MNTQTVTRWWWVRHAPVVDAHNGRLSGQADIDADVTHLESFEALAPQLPQNAKWILTPLKRTQQTAHALCRSGAPRTTAKIERAFIEQAFGDWTNKTWDEVGSTVEAQAFWNDPAHECPPGEFAESFDDVCRRVAPRIDQITHENPGRDIVCIAHAGSIRAALALALALTPEQALAIDVKNTGLTRLDFIGPQSALLEHGNWRVISLNQFC